MVGCYDRFEYPNILPDTTFDMLFYLRGVPPAVVKTIQMYRGVVAFITLQLIALVIVGLYPPLVNYLPNRSSLCRGAPPA